MAAAQSVLAVVLLFTVCGAAPDDIITTVCRFLFVENHKVNLKVLTRYYVYFLFLGP